MDENTSISLESLKEQGFTDEDLQSIQPEAPKQEEPAQPETTIPEPEQPEQPAPDGDKVSKHVPYDRFKEVNDKAKALAAELAAIRAQTAQQPAVPVLEQKPATNPQAEKAKYYAMLTDAADMEARELHGIEANEDITSLQFTDSKKYQVYLNTMNSLVQEKDAENRQAWKIQKENDTFIAHLQQDPLFPQVLQFSAQDLENMPNKQAKSIDAAAGRLMQKRATPDDFKLIASTIATYKEKYLAAARGQVPEQQHTSPLDKAEGLPRAGALSGAKTAGMSWQQVEQLIREGKSDQIPKDMLRQIDPKLIE